MRGWRAAPLALAFVAAIADAEVKAPEFTGEWTQGEALIGHAAPGAEVWFQDRILRVSPTGLFVFGLGRDETGPVKVRIKQGAEEQTFSYDVKARTYQIQPINGLPEGMVNPPKSAWKRIEKDNQRVAEARGFDTNRENFAWGFQWPVIGPIAGVYGSQRILNGVPKQPHFGTDIAVPTGTPIRATAGGIVRLARTDLYYTGGTVIIDHGYGITSTYLHMSRVDVKPGEEVQKGEVIGAVGMTGRATGPHLCFRFNWFDTRLDAALMVGPMPTAEAPAAATEERK